MQWVRFAAWRLALKRVIIVIIRNYLRFTFLCCPIFVFLLSLVVPFSYHFGHYSLSYFHTYPQTRVPNVSCTHITVSKLTECIYVCRSRYGGYLFFNLSAIVCMLQKSNNRNEKENVKLHD